MTKKETAYIAFIFCHGIEVSIRSVLSSILSATKLLLSSFTSFYYIISFRTHTLRMRQAHTQGNSTAAKMYKMEIDYTKGSLFCVFHCFFFFVGNPLSFAHSSILIYSSAHHINFHMPFDFFSCGSVL